MRDDDENDEYEVGYGKPPKHTQFAPGQSGNKGRRKRPETTAQIVARVRDELVEVNGKMITKHELAISQTVNKTIRSGNPRDLKAMFELLDKYGALPVGDAAEEARKGADRVMEKLANIINKTLDIDPADVEQLDRHVREEATMVMACPACGPALKKAWGKPDRKELSQRYGKTGLHKDVVDPRVSFGKDRK